MTEYAGKIEGKGELLSIAGASENDYSHYANQCERSSKI